MADDEDPPRRGVLHFGVPRYVTSAIAEENRAELLALTARKERRHTKDRGGLSTGIHRFFHNELVDTPFAFGTGRKLPSRHMRSRDDHFRFLNDFSYSISPIMHSIIRQIETSENVAEQLPGEREGKK